MIDGTSRSRIERGGSLSPERCRASMRTVAILANSDGWPICRPPIESQLWLDSAVPAPVPTASTITSSRMPKPYSAGATHSRMRGEIW